jgi:hypothetical protein
MSAPSSTAICQYYFNDLSSNYNVKNNKTSTYDLSLVNVGTASFPTIGVNTSKGTLMVPSLYQNTASTTNYSYYVNNSNTDIKTLSGSFSVALWFYIDSAIANSTGTVWCLSNDASGGNLITFTLRPSGLPLFCITLNGEKYYVGAIAYTLNTYNHFALVCSTSGNTSTINVYINGVLTNYNGSSSSGNTTNISRATNVITVTGSIFNGTTTSLYVLGGPSAKGITWPSNSSTQSGGFNGYISQLSIYNSALTQTNVNYLYATIALPLVSYNKFVGTSVSYVIPVTFSASGNVYLQGNSGSQNIYVYNPSIYNPSGALVTQITTSDWYYGFCTDYANNKIYCAGNSLGIINTSANTFTSRSNTSPLYAIALGPNGYLYATINGGYGIVQIDPSSNSQTRIFTSAGNIQSEGNGLWRGCTFDSNGYLYCVTDGLGYVYKFDTSGTLIGLFAALNCQYGVVTGITYDPANNIFYAITSGGAVYRIDNYGNSALHTTVSNLSFFGVCYNATDGNIYVSGRSSVGGSYVYNLTKYVPPVVTKTSYYISAKNIMNYYPFDKDLLDYSRLLPVSNSTQNLVSISNAVTVLNNGTGSLYFPGNYGLYFKLPTINFATSGITIATWAKLDKIPVTYHNRIFDFGNGYGSDGLLLSIAPAGIIEFYVLGTSYIISYVLSDCNWHHYCVIIDSNLNAIVYVDGVAQTFVNGGSSYSSVVANMPLGKNLYSNFVGASNWSTVESLFGNMNQFFLYNRAITLEELSYISNININTIFVPEYPCFLQGSKILRLNVDTDEEEYIAVEKLRKGDLILTATCGYKAVAYIGRATLHRPRDDPNPNNRLYKFREKSGRHPPLCITGEHCLLYREKDIPAKKQQEVREHMGDDYITEMYHRVPACLDDNAEPYTGSDGPVTIWHFALEHNNFYNNYAVYANGILVETCSIDYLMNLSNMELVN